MTPDATEWKRRSIFCRVTAVQRVYLLPAILALAGPALLIVLTHGSFWPLAIAWWLCAAIVAVIRSHRWRMVVTVVLIPVCVLTTFEGGLFMLPAVLTLLAIDARHSTLQAAPH
jgi:hypothetical protein